MSFRRGLHRRVARDGNSASVRDESSLSKSFQLPAFFTFVCCQTVKVFCQILLTQSTLHERLLGKSSIFGRSAYHQQSTRRAEKSAFSKLVAAPLLLSERPMSLIQLLKPIRGAIKKQWCCVSCLAEIELDIHGGCSSCGSDAVDRIGCGSLRMTASPASKIGILAEASRGASR